MKKKSFLLGMLVLTLIFGMTVVGCDDSEEEGKEEKINLPSPTGAFTFTSIPANYNNKFVILEGHFEEDQTKTMIGFKGATINTSYPNHYSTWTCVKIENGSVTIPLYTFSPSLPILTTIQAYSGSDNLFVYIYVYNTEIISERNIHNYDATVVFGTASGDTLITFPVEFTDGNATKSNDDADQKLN
jgi:hypothetical protein